MAKEIDGYKLALKMRKIRRRVPLTSTEQALYHELVARCNEESWEDVFSCSNYDLCGPLQISENTLEKSRAKLIQVGLLFYKSGKSRRVHGKYSFVKKLSFDKTTQQTTSNFEVDVGVDVGVDLGVQGSDIKNKEKSKTETKNKTSSFSDGKPPEPEKKSELFWESFIKGFHDFYKNKFGVSYNYLAKDFKHLKKIYEILKKRAAEKNMSFTEQNLVASFTFFLQRAWDKDNWLQQNFTITNCLTQFNQIANGTTNSKTGKQQTGGGVSTASLLSKIDAMPD